MKKTFYIILSMLIVGSSTVGNSSTIAPKTKSTHLKYSKKLIPNTKNTKVVKTRSNASKMAPIKKDVGDTFSIISY